MRGNRRLCHLITRSTTSTATLPKSRPLERRRKGDEGPQQNSSEERRDSGTSTTTTTLATVAAATAAAAVHSKKPRQMMDSTISSSPMESDSSLCDSLPQDDFVRQGDFMNEQIIQPTERSDIRVPSMPPQGLSSARHLQQGTATSHQKKDGGYACHQNSNYCSSHRTVGQKNNGGPSWLDDHEKSLSEFVSQLAGDVGQDRRETATNSLGGDEEESINNEIINTFCG